LKITSSIINIEKEKIVNDLEEEKMSDMDLNKLAELKAKKAEKDMSAKIVAKKERSLRFGVLGSGQAGGKLAQAMYNLGYTACAINTAMQDLKSVEIPDANKLFLQYGVGGASKDLSIGKLAAEEYREQILELVNDRLSESQVNILCLSLGGGSGAGSCEVLVDILNEVGKPLVVIAALPMDTEDAKSKSNALETLSNLAKLAQAKQVANIILVDNAKLESIYSDVSQMNFFEVANKAIVNPIDVFNTYSMMSSSTKPLDSSEFSRILLDGEGLSVYGELSVRNYQDETAIAEAIVNNLDSNLLSANFDLKQAKYVGVIISAPKRVWEDIPASSINYAMAMVQDTCGTPLAIYKGVYSVESDEDEVKVYSFYSGLGLPDARVEQLKEDVRTHLKTVKEKDVKRNLSLNLDTGTNDTVSAAQKIKDKIAQKSSAFGKLMNSSVNDRRK